mmetsp:Transcript_11023/g.40394  ORF Transcript_11023/g.40394 Transcript_11023/m.40394 type:complete len:470 (-) Transcript_11023:1089-2498(-)
MALRRALQSSACALLRGSFSASSIANTSTSSLLAGTSSTRNAFLLNGVRAMSTADRFFPKAPGRNHLFVPGPCNIPERVQRVMVRASENHRDPHFSALAFSLFEDLPKLFKSEKGTAFIFPATGTGGWEAALTNTLSPGDKVVAFRYGQFSHLWIDMAQRLGLDVEILDEEWGCGADEARLQRVLEADTDKKIKAVMVVHNETTTGVTSDIKKVREAMDAAGHDAFLMVDSVSGLGACDLRFDEWRVDLCVTGSQKSMSMPTGLGVVCASPRALEARHSAKMPRLFFDFGDMLKFNEVGNFPYTPSIPLLYALRETLDIMLEEGLDNQLARHARLAEGTRKAVKAWGLELLCKDERWNSNSLTVIKVPDGVDSNIVVNKAYTRYNLSIGIGLSQVNGKVFRIGHLGDMNEVSLLGALAGVEMALLHAGVKITPGSGVGAALQYFQETSKVIAGREQWKMGCNVHEDYVA